MVLQVLETVPKDRKCFRLVGGVLIEKTAEDAGVELNESTTKVCNSILFGRICSNFVVLSP